MTTIKIEEKDNYAILHLSNGKANPINMEMMAELCEAVEKIGQDENIKGLIINGQPNYFSVGLDVKELGSLSREETPTFFRGFDKLIFTLVQFPKPMISAITGHAPAGGCIIGICCDYRVMADDENFRIGLNEVPVGIMIPPHLHELYAFWVGKGKAYQFILEGKLHSPQEALACNLVDELAPENETLARAEAKMQQYMKFDQATLLGVKINLRHALITTMIQQATSIPIKTDQHFWRPESQAVLKKIVERL